MKLINLFVIFLNIYQGNFGNYDRIYNYSTRNVCVEDFNKFFYKYLPKVNALKAFISKYGFENELIALDGIKDIRKEDLWPLLYLHFQLLIEDFLYTNVRDTNNKRRNISAVGLSISLDSALIDIEEIVEKKKIELKNPILGVTVQKLFRKEYCQRPPLN